MRSLDLTAQTRAVLAFIRRTTFPLSVYRRSAARVWPMVREQVNRRISRFGVPLREINIHRRYTTEMLKAFRTETGEPLAAALELCVRKWGNLGLAPELLQQLLCDCHQKFHACGHQLPRRRPIVPEKKPGPGLRRKRKKTYTEALSKGAFRAVLLLPSKTNRPAKPKASSEQGDQQETICPSRYPQDTGPGVHPLKCLCSEVRPSLPHLRGQIPPNGRSRPDRSVRSQVPRRRYAPRHRRDPLRRQLAPLTATR
jgi:hypothetical protein